MHAMLIYGWVHTRKAVQCGAVDADGRYDEGSEHFEFLGPPSGSALLILQRDFSHLRWREPDRRQTLHFNDCFLFFELRFHD